MPSTGPRGVPDAHASREAGRLRSVPASRSRTPSAPRSLGQGARAVWRRLAPELHAAGRLTAFDVDAFAVYCGLVASHERAGALLDRTLLVKGRRDEAVTSPAWKIYRDTAVLIRAYAAEFGLTPRARSVLSVTAPLTVLPPSPTGGADP